VHAINWMISIIMKVGYESGSYQVKMCLTISYLVSLLLLIRINSVVIINEEAYQNLSPPPSF